MRHSLLIGVVFLILQTPAFARILTCPSDGTYLPGKGCLTVNKVSMNRDIAAEYCLDVGGVLAEPRTKDIDDAIFHLMMRHKIKIAWLGGRKVNRQWIWAKTKDPVQPLTDSWMYGHPRDDTYHPYHCMALFSTALKRGWADYQCDADWPSVCFARECPANTYEPYDCPNDCHCKHSNEHCDMRTGACAQTCDDGWQGPACQEVCDDNTFGYLCKKECHCVGDPSDRSICNHINGRCRMGCAEGWFGPACQKICTKNRWGRKCNMTCHCESALHCDNRNGHCEQDCADGWEGHPTCQKKCKADYFGKDCKTDCHCKEMDSCNHVNGFCTGGCDKDYKGDSCQEFNIEWAVGGNSGAEKARQLSLVELLIGTILTLAVGHVM